MDIQEFVSAFQQIAFEQLSPEDVPAEQDSSVRALVVCRDLADRKPLLSPELRVLLFPTDDSLKQDMIMRHASERSEAVGVFFGGKFATDRGPVLIVTMWTHSWDRSWICNSENPEWAEFEGMKNYGPSELLPSREYN